MLSSRATIDGAVVPSVEKRRVSGDGMARRVIRHVESVLHRLHAVSVEGELHPVYHKERDSTLIYDREVVYQRIWYIPVIIEYSDVLGLTYLESKRRTRHTRRRRPGMDDRYIPGTDARRVSWKEDDTGSGQSCR